SPRATAAAAGVSADQIVKDSEAKMAQLKSASFSADMGLEVQGDPSKMTDPTQKAMLSQGISLHVEGKSATDPMASDMKMSAGIAGQTLNFGMMAQGDKAWVEYQGKWYAMDAKSAKSLSTQAQTGAAPTEQLKSLGLNPSDWGTSYTLVGTESLAGTQVYHVKATADPQKLADSLMKAAESPDLQKQLGGSSSELGQLGSGLTQNKKQAQELSKSLKDATVEYWIGVDDQLMYKAQFGASMDTSAQKDMQGVTGMTLKGAVTMSKFDEPVDVTAPAGAKSFKDFMNQLFGGMLGGSSGGLTL
ncbi:MAG TPA: DUF6612 family protein, partial [Thermoleophilia bacterium]